jgi:predicted nucleic acid-binding protein
MPASVLVDTGPLVALFDADDQHHAGCVEALKTLRQPLLTIWPAVTEAMHLLAFSSPAQHGLLSWLAQLGLQLAPLESADVPRIQELLTRYHDLPMDFTDAALVAVAEREDLRTIFTVDARDFRLYRPRHTRTFQLLPAPH